jgi:hypothetical protein
LAPILLSRAFTLMPQKLIRDWINQDEKRQQVSSVDCHQGD